MRTGLLSPLWKTSQVTLYQGSVLDVLPKLPDGSVNCIVTSPPYWQLRNYGHSKQIGNEPTLSEFIQVLVKVFEECRRILKDDGTCWVNIGDTYASKWAVSRRNQVGNASLPDGSRTNRPNRMCDGLKEKDLCLVPQRLAIALQDAGWYIRQDIIWHKPNPMPESVRDRCTKAHEYLFLMSKSPTYFYAHEAFQEQVTSIKKPGNKTHKYVDAYNRSDSEEHRLKAGLLCVADIAYATRNPRSVWSISSRPYPDAHFATFPPELPRRCITAGCPPTGVVLDPFAGSGTTLWQAQELGRKAIGIELNPDYCELAFNRCRQQTIFAVEG